MLSVPPPEPDREQLTLGDRKDEDEAAEDNAVDRAVIARPSGWHKRDSTRRDGKGFVAAHWYGRHRRHSAWKAFGNRMRVCWVSTYRGWGAEHGR